MSSMRKKVLSSGFMLFIGVATIIGSLSYRIGTLIHMGPGFYPLMLGICLVIIAGLIFLEPPQSQDMKTQDIEIKTVKKNNYLLTLRGVFFIVTGTILFAVLGEYGGLIPATFCSVCVAALGERSNTLAISIVLALLVTGFAVAVFHFALQMQFPLFRWG